MDRKSHAHNSHPFVHGREDWVVLTVSWVSIRLKRPTTSGFCGSLFPLPILSQKDCMAQSRYCGSTGRRNQPGVTRNMPLAQHLRRFTGMVIEIPQIWDDDNDASSACSFFDKESVADHQWDDDHSTGCSTGCAGVRFCEDENIYYENRECDTALNLDDQWFSASEIQQFEQQARVESSLIREEWNDLKDHPMASLEKAYKTCSKAKAESSKQTVLNSEQDAALQSLYNTTTSVMGLECQIFQSHGVDRAMRRRTILQVVERIRQRRLSNNRSALLHQENAIRLACQSISRPARLFGCAIAQAQSRTLLQE